MTRLRERAHPIPDTHCEKTKDCDQRSLQIEAREAVTADGAFDVALGQLALSILGIAGVGSTVYYAHRAWREAERSARAATDAVAHAQSASQIELRAYVVPEHVKIEAEFDPVTRRLRRVDFRVSMANRGHTPARNVTACKTHGQYFGGQSPANLGYPENQQSQSHAIGPGTASWLEFSIDDELIHSISQDVSVYFWVSIEYDDVFGVERHRTESCQLLTTSGDIAQPETFKIGPAVMSSAFNGSDHDCYRQPQPWPPRAV